ncbi:MAG: DUF4249 domain-containing protein [Adhaeribacter sp.]
MKKFYSFLLVLIISQLVGCIDPLDLKTGRGTERLVVDGLITNEPGPYTVKLSMSEPYASYAGNASSFVRRATVIISDDKGNSETLTETKPGTYTTSGNNLQGQIGNTYILTVKTREGQEYTSAPELLAPVPDITDLYHEVQEQKILSASGNETSVYNVAVYVDTPDPAEQKNYYLWQWEGVHRVNTQPWNYCEKVRGKCIPMPKDCCETCWLTVFTNSINVKDDRLINGRQLKKHLVTQIPVTPRTFESKYYLEVKQLSVSEAAYDYWSMLKTQLSSVGNVQDPPPAAIVGNISNVNDPEDKPYGYFGASAVVKKSIFIRREELGVNPGELIFPDDCRVLMNSTTEKPAFW